jgi:hypothetical protein
MMKASQILVSDLDYLLRRTWYYYRVAFEVGCCPPCHNIIFALCGRQNHIYCPLAYSKY